MEGGAESRRRDARLVKESIESRDHRAGAIIRTARDLEETRRNVRPRKNEVGERASDVERHSGHERRPPATSRTSPKGTRR